ncbi:MAG TPA: serine protease [Labilithrix sp.]|nr:serine protease [Labilithrix sp.]
MRKIGHIATMLSTALLMGGAGCATEAGDVTDATGGADEGQVGVSRDALTTTQDATEDYSFMISLQDIYDTHHCGAALIAPNWAVTAEHCIHDVDAPYIQLRIGSKLVNAGGTLASVSEIIHPPVIGGWQVPSVDLYPGHDIALMRLTEPVREAPIKIATSAGIPGTVTRLIGWGHTCSGVPFNVGCTLPTILKELDTRITFDAVCSTVFINPVNETCLGGYGQPGACNGDSGGPSIRKINGQWQLTGVTSRLTAPYYVCGTAPFVYTDVTKWRAWINGETGLSL